VGGKVNLGRGGGKALAIRTMQMSTLRWSSEKEQKSTESLKTGEKVETSNKVLVMRDARCIGGNEKAV